jgi:hypothetical protein
MTLEARRSELVDAINKKAQLNAIKDLAVSWFAELKTWEGLEKFPRAFNDKRMTVRAVKPDAKIKQIKVAKTVPTTINLDGSVEGIYARLDADNFLKKWKNDKGLHDLSAVLLHPDKLISKQLFDVAPGSQLLFMPLPLEEDLAAFAALSVIAKSNRTSPLYASYETMRANFTRIKYGAMSDMHSGFLTIEKMKFDAPLQKDGRVHVRYGLANIMGGPVMQKLLDIRIQNALKYKSQIATPNKTGENNEVIISYRNHAGPFPMVGTPQSNPPNSFALVNKTDKWTLEDDGTLSPQ